MWSYIIDGITSVNVICLSSDSWIDKLFRGWHINRRILLHFKINTFYTEVSRNQTIVVVVAT